VQTEYTYEPFGNTTTSGAASTNPSQYTGRENDGTGLYYYRARYYHPGLQRFISQDPIGFRSGINLYAYVQNDPINFLDPAGLWNILGGVGGSGIAGIGGAEGSAGVVVGSSGAGVFLSGGTGGGFNVGADAFLGFVKGGIENVTGLTGNLNLSGGPLSLTLFTNPQTGEILGGTLGLNLFPQLPPGITGTWDYTWLPPPFFFPWPSPDGPGGPGGGPGGDPDGGPGQPGGDPGGSLGGPGSEPGGGPGGDPGGGPCPRCNKNT
jgi:RHS repeat-associated protein